MNTVQMKVTSFWSYIMKKRIAIVTPCILPVPATLGGAVEELITTIISDNETEKDFLIDLYSISDENAKTGSLISTYVINIDYKVPLKIADKFLDKAHRTFAGNEGYRLYDKEIAKAFEQRLSDLKEPYYAVIIENQVSIAREIIKKCQGKYEFPLYFHMHNDVDIYRSPKGLQELTKAGVQFIAVSEYIKSSILKYSKDAYVHVLYNGTGITETQTGSATKDPEKIRFLYAGRVIPEKGVLELVKAFEKLLSLTGNNKTSVTLDIYGFSDKPTKYENKVLEEAGKHKGSITCNKRIATSEMNSKYSEYDVVVMPTMNEEPFGLVALETLSKGLPLITTNSGALPEVTGDGALIVDKNADFIDNLTDAMFKTASDKEFRDELSRKAYLRARSSDAFDINNYSKNFERIIDNRKDNGKITVVVPVYNVSDYLERCVASLLNQTYNNIEILLIDDGSTDDSGRLCDKYAKSDPRIRVIHQKNMGLSGARNTGIDESSGEYLFFCDSDDYIQSDTLEYMHDKLCRDNADIVACGFSHIWEDYEETGREFIFTSDNPGAYSGRSAVIEMIINNSICTVAWNKLYRKDLFEDIRFPVGFLHEDEATVYKLLYKARIVTYTPRPFYKYFQRSSGIMGEDIENRSDDLLTALDDRISYFYDQKDLDLAEYSRIALLDRIKYIYRNVSDKKYKKELSRLYGDKIALNSAPIIMGVTKGEALLLWKYFKF